MRLFPLSTFVFHDAKGAPDCSGFYQQTVRLVLPNASFLGDQLKEELLSGPEFLLKPLHLLYYLMQFLPMGHRPFPATELAEGFQEYPEFALQPCFGLL